MRKTMLVRLCGVSEKWAVIPVNWTLASEGASFEHRSDRQPINLSGCSGRKPDCILLSQSSRFSEPDSYINGISLVTLLPPRTPEGVIYHPRASECMFQAYYCGSSRNNNGKISFAEISLCAEYCHGKIIFISTFNFHDSLKIMCMLLNL